MPTLTQQVLDELTKAANLELLQFVKKNPGEEPGDFMQPSFIAFRLATEYVLMKIGKPLTIGEIRKVMGDKFDDRKFHNAVEQSHHIETYMKGALTVYEYAAVKRELAPAEPFIIPKRRWNGGAFV